MKTIQFGFRHRDKKMVGYHTFRGYKALLINDMDLAKQMFIKDFDHFVDRRGSTSKDKYTNNMMLLAKGDIWKEIRHAASPVFTSGKLKHMSKIINRVANDLLAHLDKLSETGEDVNAEELSNKFTLQSIASSGFGLEVNSFEGDPEAMHLFKM